MNMSHVKNKWPMHVFFISQGITLFGVGYVILPVLLLLFWLVRTAIKTPDIFKDLFMDNHCYWVWIYYLLFIVMVCISDLMVGGRLTHVEGPLYNLALGIYMLLGYLVAKSYDSDEVFKHAHRWLALWLFLLLAIAEIYCHEIYRYHHGVFAHTHVFFSGLVMVALVNVVFIIERFEYKKILSWFSCILALWALFSVYKYSISDIVPHLYIAGAVLVLLLSGRKHSMSILFFLMLGTAVFIILNSHILTKLQNIDLTSQSFWMGLLNHREYVWTVTLRIFGQHPLLGVGSRNFSSLCREILAEMGLTSPEVFSHSHNIFFQNVVAHGFIAGFAYLGIFLSLFRLVVRSLKTVSREIMTWAVFSILFVYVFHGLVDVAPYNEEIIPFIWGSVGLLMGMVVKEAKMDE